MSLYKPSNLPKKWGSNGLLGECHPTKIELESPMEPEATSTSLIYSRYGNCKVKEILVALLMKFPRVTLNQFHGLISETIENEHELCSSKTILLNSINIYANLERYLKLDTKVTNKTKHTSVMLSNEGYL